MTSFESMSSIGYNSAWLQQSPMEQMNDTTDSTVCSFNATTSLDILSCGALWTHQQGGGVQRDSKAVGMKGSLYGENNVPREIVFNTDSLLSIITYSLMFIVAAGGNLTVFITLFCNRNNNISRVSVFIMHLSVADLIVTFIMLPTEIGWHATVAWKAGDTACRLLMFFRTFGFYLSSFILIAISLDRYFAITHPLSVAGASKRGRIMLILAWLFGIIASIPQSVIFHVERHPKYPWFSQCVTFHFFPTPLHEMAYNLFNVFMLYLIPLIVILVCYSLMLHEMSRKSRPSPPSNNPSLRSTVSCTESMRRSGVGQMEKARVHTLKMTIVIVAVFIICWTPYFVILALWWIDEDFAGKIDKKIQRGLFIFAVSNSCMNPIVYGMFTTVFRREVKRRFRHFMDTICRRKRRRSNQFRQNQFELYYYQNKHKLGVNSK